MKIFSARANREPLTRQTAWGCFLTNLAVPGCGSLIAGRLSGIPQLLFTLAGLTITTTFGVRFITWYLAHHSELQSPEADPVATLEEIWNHVRWAMSGVALFAVGGLWAMFTSLSLLRRARK